MSYTLRKSSQGIWIQGAPRAGRLAKSQGLLVVLGGTKTGTLRKSQEQTVNTLDQVAVRVLNMSQRLWPNGHLADVSGKLFGTGIYDPVNVSFVSIEKEVDGIGWVSVTTRPLDPAEVFPTQADGDGENFNLVVEVDEWADVSLRFRLTAGFTGLGNVLGIGGPWAWTGSGITPDGVPWLVVPSSSTSGNYSVSWGSVDGATGYELAEEAGGIWGPYIDVGLNTVVSITGKTAGAYRYKVRAYNPANPGPDVTAGPCNVIPPNPPATITVPASSSSGNFTVNWASSVDATSYDLQEDTDPLFSAPSTIYTGAGLSFPVTGKTEGDYYYRVRANGVGGSSAWTEGANGCHVARPIFKVTPDLGWADVDAMFNPLLNERMSAFPLDELSTTGLTPSPVMGRYNMVFSYGGDNYLIPGNQIGKFGASGRHLWRYMSDPVNVFTVAKEALNVGGVPSLPRSVQPRILR